MKVVAFYFTSILLSTHLLSLHSFDEPLVLVSILARNKAHALPHYLHCLDELDYPKSRTALHIRSDHNVDKTAALLTEWVRRVKRFYYHVDLEINGKSEVCFKQDEISYYPDEEGVFDWTRERYDQLISLREDALSQARHLSAHYLLFADVDNFLTDPESLKVLMNQGLPVTSPLLTAPHLPHSLYSNFWGGQHQHTGYYKRTNLYLNIIAQNTSSPACHQVPVIHSTFLIHLTNPLTHQLTFSPDKLVERGYVWEYDDVLAFSYSAHLNQSILYVCEMVKGFLLEPLASHNTLEQDKEQLTSLRVYLVGRHSPPVTPPLPISRYLPIPPPVQSRDTAGTDRIYLINLARRPDRWSRMSQSVDLLGLSVERVEAVDGKALTPRILEDMGVKPLDGYRDPYHRRGMKMGEVGCFLSHHEIWRDVVSRGYETVLVMEDDLLFEPYYRSTLVRVLDEAQRVASGWDLIYLGRKRLEHEPEPWVEGSNMLVHVGYSYWTLSYLLTREGARVLLDGLPLEKMVPVDEYIPIMFDKHPEVRWREAFKGRRLQAYSTYPLLVHPTHYTGEKDYISDTEDSPLLERDEL